MSIPTETSGEGLLGPGVGMMRDARSHTESQPSLERQRSFQPKRNWERCRPMFMLA